MYIREAGISDIPRITEIYNWAVENTTATFDLASRSYEDRVEWFSHYGHSHPLIVAVEDDKAVGYSSLSKFREKEAYSRTAEVSVYVDPLYHGRGIGTALLREIIDRAGTLGFHVIIAGITAGNDTSIRMHEKLGFRLCGCFKDVGFKFGSWQDVLFYQLILG